MKTGRCTVIRLAAAALAAASLARINEPAAAVRPEKGGPATAPAPAKEPTYRGQSLSELIAALRSKDFAARLRSVNFLGYMGAKARPAVPALVEAMDAERAPNEQERGIRRRLRYSILHALMSIGPAAEEAIPAIIEGMPEFSTSERWKAAEALAAIGKAAVPALKASAGSDNVYVRIWCSAALARLAEGESPHLRYLTSVMKSAEKGVSAEALRAMIMVGGKSAPLVADLIGAMDDFGIPHELTARALAAIGGGARTAVPVLVAALHKEDDRVRIEAVRALGAIGPDARPALGPLRKMLQASEARIRAEAAAAIGSVGRHPPPMAMVDPPQDRLDAERSQRLWQLLGDEDYERVCEAVHALAAAGNQAVAMLETRLKPLGDPKRIGQLIENLGHESHAVRDGSYHELLRCGLLAEQALADALRERPSAEARARLEALLEECANPFPPRVEPRRIARAAWVLEWIPTSQAEGARSSLSLSAAEAEQTRALIRAVDDLDDEVRTNAAEAIAQTCPNAVVAIPALIKATRSPEARTRIAAAEALLKIGPVNIEVVRAFIAILKKARYKGLHYAAGEFFSLLGPESAEAVDELTELLADPREHVRSAALTALGNIGPPAAGAVPWIVAAMDDPRTQCYAAGALKKIGARPATAELIKMLDHEDRSVRDLAADVLASIGPAARAAIPALAERVKKDHQPSLCRSLIVLDPASKEGRDAWVAISKSKVPWDRAEAHYQLVRIGHDKKAHLKALIDGLEKREPAVARMCSAVYLGHLGQAAKRAIPQLEEALTDDYPEARVEAAHAILRIGSEARLRRAAVDVIVESLGDADCMTSLRAAGALRCLGPRDKHATQGLLPHAYHVQERLRAPVVNALGNIGPAARGAMPVLEYLARNGSWPVRRAATEAVGKIEHPAGADVKSTKG